MFDTLQAALQVQTFQDLKNVFRPMFLDIGFPYFSATEASRRSDTVDLAVLFGEPDKAWLDFYTRKHLARADPRVRHMLSSAEPTFLSELSGPRELSRDHNFLTSFRAHGHADCFVWPVHLPNGCVQAVLMLSNLPNLNTDIRVTAGVLAAAFHAAGARLLRELAANNSVDIELRPRQRECLHWAGQGKSSADTGHILGISARTVDEHIAHACQALGVRTRVQAVVRALELGLI